MPQTSNRAVTRERRGPATRRPLPFRRPILRALLVAAIGVASLLLLSVDADAKLSCEERGHGGSRLMPQLRVQLPARPVADRTYPVTLSLPRATHAIRKRPKLFLRRCEAMEQGYYLRPRIVKSDGVQDDFYGGFDLKFRAPGRWAIGVLDLRGHAYDLGARTVRSAVAGGGSSPAGRAHRGSGGSGLSAVALGAGVLSFAAAAGLWAVARIRRGAGR